MSKEEGSALLVVVVLASIGALLGFAFGGTAQWCAGGAGFGGLIGLIELVSSK